MKRASPSGASSLTKLHSIRDSRLLTATPSAARTDQVQNRLQERVENTATASVPPQLDDNDFEVSDLSDEGAEIGREISVKSGFEITL